MKISYCRLSDLLCFYFADKSNCYVEVGDIFAVVHINDKFRVLIVVILAILSVLNMVFSMTIKLIIAVFLYSTNETLFFRFDKDLR